jgi:hypothetical protein
MSKVISTNVCRRNFSEKISGLLSFTGTEENCSEITLSDGGFK